MKHLWFSPKKKSQNSRHWSATLPAQPSMSPPLSASYFELSQGVPVGLDLTCDDEDEFVACEWDLAAAHGPSPATMGVEPSTDFDDALDDYVARRGQHRELEFNQRPGLVDYSPDRLEDLAWDQEDEFRISDVDMEIGAGEESVSLKWSREEDELELELEY